MAGLAPPPLLLRLSLSTCFILLMLLAAACPSLGKTPCQRSTSKDGWNNFKKKHLVPGTPLNTLDQNVWYNFIKKTTPRCDRPTQSFLNPNQENQVKDVCSKQGGKVYKENLCISPMQFRYVTVRSYEGTCDIKSIIPENKSLILACDNVNNQCVPVHFEANPYSAKPNPNARACEALYGDDENGAAMPTWHWLLAFVMVPFAIQLL